MGDQGFLVLGVAERNTTKCISSRNGKELPLKSNERSIFGSFSLLEQVCLCIYANLF